MERKEKMGKTRNNKQKSVCLEKKMKRNKSKRLTSKRKKSKIFFPFRLFPEFKFFFLLFSFCYSKQVLNVFTERKY